MIINNRKINIQTITEYWLVILAGLTGKFIQFFCLPEKYFYDSKSILRLAMTSNEGADKSYRFVSEIFRILIGVLPIHSVKYWDFFLGVIFTFIIAKFIKQYIEIETLRDIFFLLCSVVLLNIYVFNISKEVVQFIIFYMLFLLLKDRKINYRYEELSCLLILLIEASVFRTYYIFTTFLCVVFYVVFTFNNRLIKFNVLKWIVLLLMIFIAIRVLSPSIYNQLEGYRSQVNIGRLKSPDAITMIVNLIHSEGNPILFTVNIIVNLIRIFIPLEIAYRSIFYLLFALYQVIFLTYYLAAYNYVKKNCMNHKRFFIYYLMTAFFVVAAIYEPDYGSLIRHEISMFPLYSGIFLSKSEFGLCFR